MKKYGRFSNQRKIHKVELPQALNEKEMETFFHPDLNGEALNYIALVNSDENLMAGYGATQKISLKDQVMAFAGAVAGKVGATLGGAKTRLGKGLKAVRGALPTLGARGTKTPTI